MFKVNNKDTYFWQYFTPSSSVSIFDFEQAFVCLDGKIVAASLKITILRSKSFLICF